MPETSKYKIKERNKMSYSLPTYDATRESVEGIFSAMNTRGKMDLAPVIATVQEVLQAVENEGDIALARYTETFDRAQIAPSEMRVTEAEINAAFASLDEKILADLRAAAERIRAFHLAQIENGAKSFRMQTVDGGTVGMQVRPLNRVGLYVPGGSAPLPSSVLMNAIPATAAGVKELVMMTPPRPDGSVAPVIIAAAKIAGVHEIYKAGGAQAIAALAYGTESVPRVDKICGPGNIYVNTAKRLVYGVCDIDMFAGPSEILVIADDTANPLYVAADMLSQAEHDPLASAILLTPSKALLEAVKLQVQELYTKAKRQSILDRSLSDYSAFILVSDLDQAVEFSNRLAPEHLELCIEEKDQDRILSQLNNVGAVFLGNYSPEPLGDYFAGPNHVLPTSGTARFFSPLNTADFMKKISIIDYDRASLRNCAASIMNLAGFESLDCHAAAIAVRFPELLEGADNE